MQYPFLSGKNVYNSRINYVRLYFIVEDQGKINLLYLFQSCSVTVNIILY